MHSCLSVHSDVYGSQKKMAFVSIFRSSDFLMVSLADKRWRDNFQKECDNRFYRFIFGVMSTTELFLLFFFVWIE